MISPAKLLDTNICIYVARNHPATVARRFVRAVPGSLGISIITWGELCFGAAKSNDPPGVYSLLEQFSRMVKVLPLPAEAGPHYGAVRAALQKAGKLIGNNDLWIAAHALALGVPLVSNNLHELERVPGLKLENWVQVIELRGNPKRARSYGPRTDAAPAHHQGRHLHPGATRRGEETRLGRHQHDERLKEGLRVRLTHFVVPTTTSRNVMRAVRSRILLASAASLLALGACSPANDGQTKGPAAATVDGKAISQRTVDMIVKQGVDAGRPDTPETRKAIIDQLALQMVVAEAAVKKGLDKTAEVAEQIDVMKQSILANAYVQDFVKNTPVTDEMVKAEYDRIKATVAGTEYKARHILVEKESEAKDIIARLMKEPGAFERLARERSKDSGSKPRGGDLGWIDPSRMVPEFSAALSTLKKGKFTVEPVKTRFGYHVILLEDAKPVEAPPLDEVKSQLSQQLQQQNVKKHVDALKAGAKIEVAGAPASAPAPAAPAAAPAK